MFAELTEDLLDLEAQEEGTDPLLADQCGGGGILGWLICNCIGSCSSSGGPEHTW